MTSQLITRPILAASILGADPLNLEAAIKACEKTKLVDWVQVDVMDGVFAPNLSFGPAVVQAIAKRGSLYVDVHMMVQDPYVLLEPFAKAGADLITVHAEAKNPKECLRKIRSLGKKAGLAIKPKTPAKAILPFAQLLDLVLVMTVEPGFAGQAFLHQCIAKITEVKRLLRDYPGIAYLEVDGGIAEATIGLTAKAGANVFVCGSSLFKDKPAKTAPRLFRAARRFSKNNSAV